MADNRELGLKIPVECIGEHLSCPVCMNRLKHTYMTPCGHRYCEPCISEWIGRHQRCPCCNTRLNKEQLIKDALFDNLIESVTNEESNAEEKYFDNLISAAAENAFSVVDSEHSGNVIAAADLRKMFSPVEKVLKNHLRQSLVSHEKFCQDLLNEHKRREAELTSTLHKSILDLQNSGLSTEEARRTLEKDTEIQRLSLTNDLNRSTQLVAEAYNRYLQEHIPDFSILPVTIGVSLLNRGIQLSEIILKPQDSLQDLERMIKDRMRESGDQVVEFADDLKYFCFSPFAKRSLYEMKEVISGIVENGLTCPPDITTLPRGCHPVLQLAVKPGSEIVLYGMIKCESDKPKQCFAVTFSNNSNNGASPQLAMDYFSCKNCSTKWICRPCMDVCHKGHVVEPYIMNHKPTWACCYCPKKKKCLIQS